MKTTRSKNNSRELAECRARLAVAEETLRAIRSGEVDTVMVAGKEGSQVFTLEGAEQAYRLLIESMNEGAVTLTSDKTILYANHCFARMIKCPLEQVIGSSFRTFLTPGDLAALKPHLKRAGQTGSKIEVRLKADDGSHTPARISVCPLQKHSSNQAAFGLVVTDMSESKRTEELLRALTHRVVRMQESERGRVALELHDNITQLLIAVIIRSKTLADGFSGHNAGTRKEAMGIGRMLGHAADEVERISRNLRPGVLEHLGLVAVFHASSQEFEKQNGVPVQLTCVTLKTRMPAETELALYRILQEALKNISKHSRAKQVSICLTKKEGIVALTIKDDGIGFEADHFFTKTKGNGGLGLLGMLERAAYVGGAFTIKSARRWGTEIQVSIPLFKKAPPGNQLDQLNQPTKRNYEKNNRATGR